MITDVSNESPVDGLFSRVAMLEEENDDLRFKLEAAQTVMDVYDAAQSGSGCPSDEPLHIQIKEFIAKLEAAERKIVDVTSQRDALRKDAVSAPPSEWVRKSELDAVIDWAWFAKEALNEVAAYGNCDCAPDEPCVYCQCVKANDLGTPIIENLKTLRGEK